MAREEYTYFIDTSLIFKDSFLNGYNIRMSTTILQELYYRGVCTLRQLRI